MLLQKVPNLDQPNTAALTAIGATFGSRWPSSYSRGRPLLLITVGSASMDVFAYIGCPVVFSTLLILDPQLLEVTERQGVRVSYDLT